MTHNPEQLPPDPDLDHLPDELAHHPGPFTITGTDEDGNVWSAPIEREHLAAGFADRRRLDDDNDTDAT